ncbi:hypothetical protein PV08_07186 [Exophiala spinifera]|uniref:Uncharacterized protein n=1 Tax=Exophiala spinifera TaxID=91928 RepID=A0A0D2BT11_9EURO|nr:uncharacterized protein PV08_07186 [Exophiala spinifera]KIW14404.1 hypothetical protein PV08_07186 [Exophiala spinifera]
MESSRSQDPTFQGRWDGQQLTLAPPASREELRVSAERWASWTTHIYGTNGRARKRKRPSKASRKQSNPGSSNTSTKNTVKGSVKTPAKDQAVNMGRYLISPPNMGRYPVTPPHRRASVTAGGNAANSANQTNLKVDVDRGHWSARGQTRVKKTDTSMTEEERVLQDGDNDERHSPIKRRKKNHK